MIRNLRVASLTALVAATAALAAAPSAFAEERSCRGTLGAITVDNLRVPQGATCTLNGTRVKGTVKVERAATLHATGIRVIGNVQAGGAARVNLKASNVGGSIQVVQGCQATVDREHHQGRRAVLREPRGGRDQLEPDRRQPPAGTKRVHQIGHVRARASTE